MEVQCLIFWYLSFGIMNVAYVTVQFPSPSETFAARDIRTLAANGVELEVYSMRERHQDDETLAREQAVSDVARHHLDLGTLLSGLIYAFVRPFLLAKVLVWIAKRETTRPKELIKCIALLPSAFYISRKVRKRHPDVVHLFWGHYPSIVGFLLYQHARPPVLSMFIGAYDLELDLEISRWMLRHADCVFTHSRANLDSLVKARGSMDGINVIYRGLDLQRFPPVSEDELTGRESRIFTAGRLVKSKGFDQAIRLVHSLDAGGVSVALTIGGKGPDRERLERLAESLDVSHLVEFTGHISPTMVRDYMIKSKIFMLLSDAKGERLPNVVKEAMVSGCICVVSKSTGIGELVVDGVNGYVVAKYEIEEVASLVQSLLNNDGHLLLRRKAVSDIVGKFSVNESMREYKRQWSNEINRNGCANA